MEASKSFRPSDIRQVLKSVYRRKWLLIVPWIIISGLSVAGSYLISPQYKASTIISVDSQIILSSSMRQLLGNVGGTNWRQDRSRLLRSYYNEITSATFLGRLDERLNLSSSAAMKEAIDRTQAEMPNTPRDQIVIYVLQSSFKDRIEVEFVGEDQLQISISSTSPTEASDLVNGLGEIFIEEKYLQRMNLSRVQGDLSDTQLEKFELKLQDAIATKASFETYMIENRLSDAVISIENQTDISTELYDVNMEIERQKDRGEQLLGQLQSSDDRRVSNPRLEQSDIIKNFIRSCGNELESIGELILAREWNSSPIQSLRIRLNGTITDIEEENDRLVDNQFSDQSPETRNLLTLLFNSRSNLILYQDRADAIDTGLTELMTRINKVAEDRAHLDQLERDVFSATLSRDKWKQEQETSAVSQDIYEDARFRVIEPGRVPLVPFKPNRIQIGILGILLGLIIGGAAVVTVELMDNSFKKVEEIPEELGLPVLGIAPKMPFLKKVGS